MNSSYAARGSLLLFCFALIAAALCIPALLAAADTVSLLSFGDAGFGDDDTTVFQNARDSTAANGQVLEIPAGSYNISPIYFPSGADVQCDAGVTVNANDGYGRVAIMLNLAANNITLTGPGGSVDPSVSTCVFQMPLVFAQSSNDGSEYRHCMAIYGGADNVNVSGIACNHAGGDGIYVTQATNVTVSNSIFSPNYRNGRSLTGRTNHVTFTGDQFLNQRNTNSGFDIEPNLPTDFVKDLNFDQSAFNNNELAGLCVCISKLDGTSEPISITVTNSVANGNGDANGFTGKNGLFFDNNNGGPDNDGSPIRFPQRHQFLHRQFRLCGRHWKVVWERGSRQFYKRDRHKPIYRWDGRSACWWQCGRWSIGLRWIELLSRKCPLLTNKREQHQWKHVLLFRPLRQRQQL
jgi:hypothetical protein